MARVLVVDDNADVVQTLTMLLEAAGHRVIAAADGWSALAKAARDAPDVVLLDIGLPGMGGVEVARQLRKEYGNALRLVAHTANPTGEAIARAGFDGILTKPAGIDDVLAAIEGEREGGPNPDLDRMPVRRPHGRDASPVPETRVAHAGHDLQTFDRVRKRVAEGERRIAEQETRIRDLRRQAGDLTLAVSVLEHFVECQRVVQDRLSVEERYLRCDDERADRR